MSAFDDYLAQLRRLDEARRGADEAAARSASVTESLGQRTERLAEQAASQRAAVDELARAARTEPPPRVAGAPLGGDPAVEIDAAEADLQTAATELEDARFLAHRPPWLPRWRTDERNGLVYGLFALASLLVQLLVLRLVKADDLMGAIVLAAVVVACPLLAFALAWLTIGVTSRPRITDEEKKLERNFRLGLVLCGSTLIVSCFGFFS
ncbi:hypothetical protein [Glycomyces tenuis]|uniref:hypothetical protein n=1 Tax=Glycomyces tenuis TaxID=58116 RepID=UPI0004073DE1|nr:hypothetical protein [Glycomyces tenuis]